MNTYIVGFTCESNLPGLQGIIGRMQYALLTCKASDLIEKAFSLVGVGTDDHIAARVEWKRIDAGAIAAYSVNTRVTLFTPEQVRAYDGGFNDEPLYEGGFVARALYGLGVQHREEAQRHLRFKPRVAMEVEWAGPKHNLS